MRSLLSSMALIALLPSAIAGGFSILNTSTEKTCPPSSPTCRIPIKTSLVLSTTPPSCRVDLQIGTIMNPNRQKGVDKPVRLLWEIEKDPADTTDYRFTATGIELLDAKNDDDFDLDNGGWPKKTDGSGDFDKQKYKWRNLNARFVRLTYNVNIEFKTSTMANYKPCDSVDPVIVNKGD